MRRFANHLQTLRQCSASDLYASKEYCPYQPTSIEDVRSGWRGEPGAAPEHLKKIALEAALRTLRHAQHDRPEFLTVARLLPHKDARQRLSVRQALQLNRDSACYCVFSFIPTTESVVESSKAFCGGDEGNSGLGRIKPCSSATTRSL
eukprot:s4363_g1.t1